MKERNEKVKYGVGQMERMGKMRGERDWRSFEVMAGWMPCKLMAGCGLLLTLMLQLRTELQNSG